MIKNIQLPVSKILGILLGFPLISFLLSLLLLNKDAFEKFHLDFFSTFWIIVFFWYIIQVLIVSKALRSEGYKLKDIGFDIRKKQFKIIIIGYFIFSFILFGFVEFALSSSDVDQSKFAELSDLSNLTPKTTWQRIIFIFAGFVAGISEEIVYRGFAISAVKGKKVNIWISIVLVAIPFVFQHGLKSIDQFWWFFIWGILFGLVYIISKGKLYITIIIHWLIIQSAMLAILQTLD